MSIDFEKEAKRRREENMYTLKRELAHYNLEKSLKEKINNYAYRYSLPVNYVYDKLKFSYDDMLLNGFEKDPGRQNIYEMLQLELIKSIESNIGIICDVKKLPAGGKMAKCIKEGKIVYLPSREKKELKTIDFYRYYEFLKEKLEFYATCKYTKDEGGAQDNQSNDVITSFNHALEIEDPNIFFIALVDGDYYQKRTAKRDNKDFISSLNGFQNIYKRCKATTSDDLLCLLKDEIKKWLLGKNFPKDLMEKELERIESI